MVLLNVPFSNHVEILDKIRQNIDGGFSGREWGYILVFDMGGC